MTPANPQHKDGKLLLAVCGLVVAGAIGITLIAGLALDDNPVAEADSSTPKFEAAPTPIEQPVEVTVTPASFTTVAGESSETPTTEAQAEAEEVGFTIDPDENLVQRGVQLYESRQFDRAAAYFRAEVEARPARAWTQYMHGLSLWKSGSPVEAEQAMQAAAGSDPTSIRIFVNLARIRNDLERYEGALAASRDALEIDGESASALFVEGRSLMNLGLFDEAVQSLEASIEREPDNGYARNMLGLTLIRRGTPQDALVHLERAAELIPQVAFVHNNLGMARELSGDRAGAVAAYRAGANVDPTHVRVVANLARLEPGVPVTVTLPPETAQDSEPQTQELDSTTPLIAQSEPEPATEEDQAP